MEVPGDLKTQLNLKMSAHDVMKLAEIVSLTNTYTIRAIAGNYPDTPTTLGEIIKAVAKDYDQIIQEGRVGSIWYSDQHDPD